MIRAIARTGLHLASELGLSALTVAISVTLFDRRAFPEALLVAFLGGLTVSRAVSVLRARQTLRLAWRFPRVDALGLAIPRDEEGWRAIEAGEAVLAALDSDARAYREFFPTARRDVRLALERALQPSAKAEEVQALTASLRGIELRLRNMKSSQSAPAALEALDALAARSSALAEAVDELSVRPNVISLRQGGRA